MSASSYPHRVLFLDHTGVLGGAEFFLLELQELAPPGLVLLFSHGPLEKRLQQAGVPFEVETGGSAVLEVERGHPGLAQLRALPGVLRLAWRVIRQLREFDAVLANSQKAFVIGALAAWFSRKPLLWYLQDIVTAQHFSAFNRHLVTTLANRFARRILVNSRASEEAFVEAGGRRELVSVIYPGIDLPPLKSGEEEIALLRRQHSGEGKKVVAVFSRLAPWKGQHVLLAAAVQLPGVHVWFVGSALFSGEASYEQELRDLARDLGITDRVSFLGFRDDVPQLLQAVDLVVHTSVAPEPFGRVIVEGMLAGKAVIATRAGGVLEIIEDGVTGRLVTPGDSQELAAALAELLNDVALAGRIAEAGQRHAQEHFSASTMIAGVKREISRACGAHPVPVVKQLSDSHAS